MNVNLERIGAGAFDYDFGALDDTDNPLTKSYLNMMYGDVPSPSVAQGSRCANALFPSYTAFGNPSRSRVFFVSMTRWFPGLLTWIYRNSSSPAMQALRRNKAEAFSVARMLLDSKRQELEDGAPGRDIMSLLGLLLSLLILFVWSLRASPSVKASTSVSQHPDRGLTDEEIISQVRSALFLIITLISPHSLPAVRS